MEEKFYQKKWFIWLALFVFWPVGLYLMLRSLKFGKVIKSIMTVLCALVALITLVGITSTPTPAPTPKSKTPVAAVEAKKEPLASDKGDNQAVEHAAKKEEPQKPEVNNNQTVDKKKELPKKAEDLPAYLELFAPKEAKGKIHLYPMDDPGKYFISGEWDLDVPFGGKATAKGYARDFIFAAYNAIYTNNLPVYYVSCVQGTPDGQLGLTVGLGRIAADSQPRETWTDNNVGPSIFLNWIKRNKREGATMAHRVACFGIYAAD